MPVLIMASEQIQYHVAALKPCLSHWAKIRQGNYKHPVLNAMSLGNMLSMISLKKDAVLGKQLLMDLPFLIN